MAFGNTVKDGSGTAYWLLQDAGGRLIISEVWQSSLQTDIIADDSDKTFAVPSDTEWKIQSVWVKFTSTNSAGNRQLCVEIQDDSANVIAQVRAGVVQAASLTRYYLFSDFVLDQTAFRDTDHLTVRMPSWQLPADYVIRVYDKAAVDAAADDMEVNILLKSRSVA